MQLASQQRITLVSDLIKPVRIVDFRWRKRLNQRQVLVFSKEIHPVHVVDVWWSKRPAQVFFSVVDDVHLRQVTIIVIIIEAYLHIVIIIEA
jgi:hypothetical protein